MVPSMEWELFKLFGGQTDIKFSIVPFVFYPKLIFVVVRRFVESFYRFGGLILI